MPDDISYADALAELEAIVVGLDGGAIDVDAVATKVARAAELITICRERIAATRLDVERIVVDMEGE